MKRQNIDLRKVRRRCMGFCGRTRSQPSVYPGPWLELFHQEVFAADEATAQAERGQGARVPSWRAKLSRSWTRAFEV
jgi:hypothetical protein